jgi:hypothetical protein
MKMLNLYAIATPSVKGIYTVLFCMLFTSTLFSQDHNWEIGVGLRPLTWNEDPYSFIAKKYLSRNTALRFGASFLYKQKDDYTEYIHPYPEDSFSYRSFYTRTDKKLNASAFIGFQYGKKKNTFYWYGATDFSARFNKNTPIVNGIYGDFRPFINGIRPGDLFIYGPFFKDKILGVGIRQNFGIQYFINTNISVSIEGGACFERYYLRRSGFMQYTMASLKSDALHTGVQFYQPKELWQYDFHVSLLSFLIFFYHF